MWFKRKRPSKAPESKSGFSRFREEMRKDMEQARADYRAEREQIRAEHRERQERIWADAAASRERRHAASQDRIEKRRNKASRESAAGADPVDNGWYPASTSLPVVQVRYYDGGPDYETWGYLWGLEEKPKVGDWVVVPAGGEVEVGRVERFGAGGYRGELKKVHRFATRGEVKAAKAGR